MQKIQNAFIILLFVSILFYLSLIRINQKSKDVTDFLAKTLDGVDVIFTNDKIHIFYDGSFRNQKLDKVYQGWLLGNKSLNELDSTFYPEKGLYSSNDPEVVDSHMKQIRNMGIGVLVVSWWPDDHDNSPPMSLILNCAQKYDLKVTIHIQKFQKRSINRIINHLIAVLQTYGNHSAFYKSKVVFKTHPLPLIYIFEPLSIRLDDWRAALDPSSNRTLRGTQFDAIFVGLIIKKTHQDLLANSHFDGFYTLFSHRKFTYATTWLHWQSIEKFARDHQMIFIPTVSPGYNYRLSAKGVGPELIPPSTLRQYGAFYENAWMRAIASSSKFVAINSFNGWLTGTQIEPARMDFELARQILMLNQTDIYADYGPEANDYYLELTRQWAIEFSKSWLFNNI